MILSGGKTSYEIGKFEIEHDLSQVFLVFDLSKFNDKNFLYKAFEDTIKDLHSSLPIDANNKVRYPGEGIIQEMKILKMEFQ